MYKAVDIKIQFSKMEQQILEYWDTHDIFRKSIAQNEGKEKFVFYDGPPFATGLPHFGHLVPSTVKDIIPRYQTMKGKQVFRRFGWDCHGLPVEYEAEKELGISGKHEIEQYGIAKFNEYCKSIVQRYAVEWRTVITRLGRWVDFDNGYKTMDTPYMESIWWVFKTLWEKGYIYDGYYILPYSPSLATPLSNFEVNLGGYHPVHDPAITVKFAVTGMPNTFFLAWTTTPWTLPSNQGLGVGSDIDYVQLLDGDEVYIIAESRISHYYRDALEYTIKKRMKGSDLVGMQYEPLFSYFAYLTDAGGFRVHDADFVNAEDGTGIVHLAGGFGEDDYNTICKKAGLPVLCPIDAECRFTQEVPDYQGVFVKDADTAIIKQLKIEGKLVRREQYLHNYPFCYRTKKPLIYRAVSSWFVNVNKLKQRMIDANKNVVWCPEHIKTGRFGKWLDNACDWAISRNRYWGNPIPVWMNEDKSCIEVIGSIEALEQKSGESITDLHKHIIDKITWPAPNGKGTMKRIPEVLDCWFESGAMPYAQDHYPFNDTDWFESRFPAHFISEGLDQTRGWFYTLTVLAAALFERSAFNNVIVSGLVLAEDGKKMSKSERNFTDPSEVMDEFGADALRLFLSNSSVLKAEDLKYANENVREEIKNFLLPLWSTYSFFVTYANIDGVQATGDCTSLENSLDQWILSELSALVDVVDTNLTEYNILQALHALYEFLDVLNNWYIRRSRRRFWKGSNDIDKLQGYETLYKVLMTFVQLSAPIVPFVTESIYQNLRSVDMPISVHLCFFPVADYERDRNLEHKMRTVRRAVALGRGIRNIHQIKNRQPLSAVHCVTRDEKERQSLQEMETILCEELNVKQVIFRQNEEDLVYYQVKANYRVLGKTLGKDMKKVASAIAHLNSDQIRFILEGNVLSLEVDGREVSVNTDNVIIDRVEKDNFKTLNEGSLTVALDPTLTPELIQEGLVRDLVRNVQNIRKNIGLDVVDRISIGFKTDDTNIIQAVEHFKSYLMTETLAMAVHTKLHANSNVRETVEINDSKVTISVGKA